MSNIKLTPKEKQNLAEFSKVGRRIAGKTRFTDKMLILIKNLYKNPYFEDYLESKHLFEKGIKNYADYLHSIVVSDRENIKEIEKELKSKERELYSKDELKRKKKTLKKHMKEEDRCRNSTVLPKKFNIEKLKQLIPGYFSRIMLKFSEQHKETVKKRSIEKFYKTTPIYSNFIRPKLSKIIDSWKAELNESLYNSTLIRVEHLKDRMEIGDLSGDSPYLKYLNYKSEFKFHEKKPGRRRSVITMIGTIKKERIRKDTKEIVQSNIDNFLEKMAIKLRWLQKTPKKVSVDSGKIKGILCCDLTLYYNKPLILQTTYETAWSVLDNPFVRFPTRFIVDGKMKSMEWVSENFFK